MRERAVAMQVASLQTSFVNAFLQVAKARDLFYWLGSFYVLAGLGMVAGFSRYAILHFPSSTLYCEGQRSHLPLLPSSPSHLLLPTMQTLPMAPSSTGSSEWCPASAENSPKHLFSEPSLRTSWCTRGTWLICRADFLPFHPSVTAASPKLNTAPRPEKKIFFYFKATDFNLKGCNQ